MELKDYVVSFISFDDPKRHFIIDDLILCGKRNKFSDTYVHPKFNVTNFRDYYFFELLCPDCINKLPDKISREVKFKYIVVKLKG